MFPAYPQAQTFYGGRMTNDRLLAVKNATCEAIDHLHKSLESCPDAEAEAPDPKGIKVLHTASLTTVAKKKSDNNDYIFTKTSKIKETHSSTQIFWLITQGLVLGSVSK